MTCYWCPVHHCAQRSVSGSHMCWYRCAIVSRCTVRVIMSQESLLVGLYLGKIFFWLEFDPATPVLALPSQSAFCFSVPVLLIQRESALLDMSLPLSLCNILPLTLVSERRFAGLGGCINQTAYITGIQVLPSVTAGVLVSLSGARVTGSFGAERTERYRTGMRVLDIWSLAICTLAVCCTTCNSAKL